MAQLFNLNEDNEKSIDLLSLIERNGSYESAINLINMGANVNHQHETVIFNGLKIYPTPLYYATINENYKLLELLIAKGANPIIQLNKDEYTNIPISVIFYASGDILITIDALVYQYQPLNYPNLVNKFLIGKYNIQEIIGKGGFGTVNRGINKITGGIVAIKHINTFNEEKYQIDIIRAISEYNLIRGLNCIYAPCVYDVYAESFYIIIVMEYIEGVRLTDIIIKKLFNMEQIKNTIKLLLEGINFYHNLGIAHNDIKSDNIIIRSIDNKPVIVDFGLGCIERDIVYLNPDQFQNVAKCNRETAGTRPYMAPEKFIYVLGKTDWRKSDIWALGVTLYHWINGSYPYLYGYGTVPTIHICSHSNNGVLDILADLMLIKNLHKRPTADLLLSLFNIKNINEMRNLYNNLTQTDRCLSSMSQIPDISTGNIPEKIPPYPTEILFPISL